MLQYGVCSMRWLTEEDFERERESEVDKTEYLKV